MTCPSFYVSIQEHCTDTLAEFASRLQRCTKKSVGSVEIGELCSITDCPNGVYVFYDDQDVPWYVGKASSRSFVERIPSHFDPRADGWFGTLPKRIMSICKTTDYCDAIQLGLSLRLVLIGVQTKDVATKVENVLRTYLQPMLNATGNDPYPEHEMLTTFLN
ncbi:MAG: hypothetical protein WC073_06450 [Sterolibacterium sp.]